MCPSAGQILSWCGIAPQCSWEGRKSQGFLCTPGSLGHVPEWALGGCWPCPATPEQGTEGLRWAVPQEEARGWLGLARGLFMLAPARVPLGSGGKGDFLGSKAPPTIALEELQLPNSPLGPGESVTPKAM